MNATIKQNNTLEKFLDNSDKFFARTFEDIFKRNFYNPEDSNIREENDSYKIAIGVPGMTRKNITITVDDNVISVWAQINEKDRSSHLMEFSSKQFKRSFPLPTGGDINNITAKCRNGLLEIRIGKVKAKGSHRLIQVNGGDSQEDLRNKATSWWSNLIEKANRLLPKKRLLASLRH